MKAAVLREVGRPIEVEEIRLDKPGPREVLVRTVATGLCHSDLHFIEGAWPLKLPAVLGHETSGVVEMVGSEVHTVKPGDHVITRLNVFCGHCDMCVTGHLSLCGAPETARHAAEAPRISLGGHPLTPFFNLSSFAENILVHENAVVAIRRDMPMDRAALIGCAVMTGYGTIVHTSDVRPGETVAVIGCGGIGLSAINAAAIVGASRIIAIDTLPAKEAIARSFGATDFICAATEDPVAAVRELTRGGVDHALECIGLAKTAEQAFNMLRARGTATVIGMMKPGEKVQVSGIDLLAEKRLQGSKMGSNRFPVDMPRLVDFYMQGRLKLDELISRHIRLDQINEGFADMKGGQLARSVIMFDS